MTGEIKASLDITDHLVLENHKVEVKRGFSIDTAFWETVSAFANTSGGVIVLGLEETPDGFVATRGFDAGKVEDQLVGMLNEKPQQQPKVTPLPVTRAELGVYAGSPVIVVTVEAMRSHSQLVKMMPCFITKRGVKDGSYKRVLSADVKLSAYEIYQLQTLFDTDSTDVEPVTEAAMEDLDTAQVDTVVRDLRAGGSRILMGTDSMEEVGERLNVCDAQGTPTLAGLLTFGFYPQQFFTQLFIDVTEHPTTQKSQDSIRFTSRQVCDGALPYAVNDAVHAVLGRLRTRYVEKGPDVIEEPEIPEIVIREAILNAVMHRDYSIPVRGCQVAVDIFPDRVEVNNPGGLWGDRTVENLRDNRSTSRNAALARILSITPNPQGTGRVAENQGSGINRMLYGMSKHGLPVPEFRAEIGEFTVILSRFGLLTPELAEWVEEIAPGRSRAMQIALVQARELGAVTVATLRRHVGLDSDELRAQLQSLVDDGLFQKQGDRYLLGLETFEVSGSEKSIMGVLSLTEELSVHDIAQEAGISLSTARQRLRELIDKGLVIATAPPQSKNRKYLRAR